MDDTNDLIVPSSAKVVLHYADGSVVSETTVLNYLSSFRNRWWLRSGHKPPYGQTLDYTVHRGRQSAISGGFYSWGPTESSADRWEATFTPHLVDLYGLIASCGADDVDSYYYRQNAVNELILKAGQSQFQLPVFLAEFGKTIDFVHDLARRAQAARRFIRNTPRMFYRDLSVRRNVAQFYGRNVESVLDLLSEAWLVWRYCLLTGLMDAEDMGETAAHLHQLSPGRVDRIVRNPKSRSGPAKSINFDSLLYLPGAPSGSVSGKARWTSKVKAWATITQAVEPFQGSLSLLHSLGLNPLSVAWELIPLSFVADWAVNFDDYFRSQTALLGKGVLDAGIGILNAVEGTVVFRPQFPTSGPPTQVSFRVELYTREPLALSYEWLPTPVGSILNMDRVRDTAALLKVLSKPH